MKKSTRIVKSLIALSLVLLLSIESFAAVVGDNDGAAFITKAEFDSMKNDFQSQLDRYNSSIDNKIDGAIANYLAGIKLSKETKLDDLIGRAKTNDICNVSFCKWEVPNATNDVPDVSAGCYWRYVDGYSNTRDSERGDGVLFGGIQLSNRYAWDGSMGLIKYRNYDEPVGNFTSIWHTSGGGYWEWMNTKKSLTSTYTNNVTFNWKWNRQKIYDLEWSRLTKEYYNSQFLYPYYVYYGIPICKTPTGPGKLKLKLKFTNEILTTGNPLRPSLGGYTYIIMDKMFKNGDLPTMKETDSYYIDEDGYNHVMKQETIDTGNDSVWLTDWLEFDKEKIVDGNNGDYIYIKIEPNNPNQVVQVEVADSILYVED